MKERSQRAARRTLAAVLVGIMLLSLGATSAGAEKNKKYLLRWKFGEGRTLKYNWQVESELRWQPQRSDLTWVAVDTDFTFELKEKLVRESGACTFNLYGKNLKGKVKGPEGTLTIDATERSARIKRADKSATIKADSPFEKEMTVTIGPRGAVRYGTGVWPIAPFFHVGVDNIFWHILTTAPSREVAVGDKWDVDFNLRLPDSRGNPLHVTGTGRVTGWKTIKGHKCLALKLECVLELKDTTVTFKNGDQRHINKGRYEVSGTAMWDTRQGILCGAEANGELLLDTDQPDKSTLKGKGRTKLSLLSAKK